ncbi:MAG: HAD family hydrolase [Candidatus Muiribacteriota bacterium]
MKAILFDIDGTLINCNKAGRIAVRKTFLDLYHIDIEKENIDFTGKTDFLIYSLIKKRFGLKISDYDQIMITYISYLGQTIKETKGFTLPGVYELIRTLARDSELVLGLLSGNIYDGARIKLDYFDLFDYFPFGIFGNSSHDRNTLADFALRRLKHLYNDDFKGEDIVVVGDTKFDIICGKYIGARTIGVLTGKTSEDVFKEYEADYIIEDLSNPSHFLSIIK